MRTLDHQRPAACWNDLLDGDIWEASPALTNPENDGLNLIHISSRPPAQAWKVFYLGHCMVVVAAGDGPNLLSFSVSSSSVWQY